MSHNFHQFNPFAATVVGGIPSHLLMSSILISSWLSLYGSFLMAQCCGRCFLGGESGPFATVDRLVSDMCYVPSDTRLGFRCITIVCWQELVITASPDASIRVWGVSSAQCGQMIRAHDAPVTGISLHATGDYLLSCSTDKVSVLFKISHFFLSISSNQTSKPVSSNQTSQPSPPIRRLNPSTPTKCLNLCVFPAFAQRLVFRYASFKSFGVSLFTKRLSE